MHYEASLREPYMLFGTTRFSKGKGKGKLLGRSPNSSVSVIPTCPSQQPFRLAGSPTP